MFLGFLDLCAKKGKMLYSGHLMLQLWVRNNLISREEGKIEDYGKTRSVWTNYTRRREGNKDGTLGGKFKF